MPNSNILIGSVHRYIKMLPTFLLLQLTCDRFEHSFISLHHLPLLVYPLELYTTEQPVQLLDRCVDNLKQASPRAWFAGSHAHPSF
jgi:hypothetical protein